MSKYIPQPAAGMERLVNQRNHVAVISVHGMTCNSCVDLIQHAVCQLKGMNVVKVRIVPLLIGIIMNIRLRKIF